LELFFFFASGGSKPHTLAAIFFGNGC